MLGGKYSAPVVTALALACALPAQAAASKRPDLLVATLGPAPATLAPLARVAVKATIRNAGRARAGSSVLRVYLASHRTHSANDLRLLGTIAVKKLRAGHTITVHGVVVVPAAAAGGAVRLIACADDTNRVREVLETNNCRTAALATTIVLPRLPGASQPPVVPLPDSGQPVTVTPAPQPEPQPQPGPTPTGPAPTPGAPGANDPIPDPPAAPVAPPVAPREATPIADATKFLYTGDHPVQTGVGQGAITDDRAAVLRGRVIATDGRPLPSVTVTIKDDAMLGQTVTRDDGRYDLAVNGGTPVTVHFARPGYLPADRTVDPSVQDYEHLDDVALTSYDPNVTAVSAGAATPQIVQGGVTDDASGKRRATLIFLPGTHATIHLPGGTQTPDVFHVRATEYTAGANGPATMPGDLPPDSGYTYAADYSLDEAVTAGADAVTFDKPVVNYVDNFLGFPVGSAVPLGSYDKRTATWTPEGNGRVVKVVGPGELDVDGDGTADSGAALDALGITAAELQALSGLYQTGTELWRVQVSHFSPWDHNWPYGPPPDADNPNPKPPKPNDPKDPKDPNDPCKDDTGSSVECESRALHEELAVAGTPYHLHYSSASGAGSRSVDIHLTGHAVPASLDHIELAVDIAGRHITFPSFAPTPDQSTTFTWDGTDAYGRQLPGRHRAVATISWVYPAVYMTPAQQDEAFARYGGNLTAIQARRQIVFTKRFEFSLGSPFTPPAGLGGWTLDAQHVYDPGSQSAQLGTADKINAPVSDVSDLLIDRYARLSYPDNSHIMGVAPQPDGTVWVAEQQYHSATNTYSDILIQRVTKAGQTSLVATIPRPPPLNQGLNNVDLAKAPGGGAYVMPLYRNNVPLWKVDADGTVHQITAFDPDNTHPSSPNGGDGMKADQVLLNYPGAIASGPDGSVYVAEALSPARVVKIGPDGVVSTVIPAGSYSLIEGLAVGPHDEIFVMLDRVIYRLLPSGQLRREFGGGSAACCTSGQPATSVNYPYYGPLATTPEGDLLANDGNRIDVVGGDGLLRLIVGTPGSHTFDDNDGLSGVPALSVHIPLVQDVDTGPDGTIFVSNTDSGLRSVHPGLNGFSVSGYPVPSADGSQVYVFNTGGRHEKTIDALSGATVQQFGYDDAGRLHTIADRDGRTTTIERDSAGAPTAIVAPDGERTTLTLDAAGRLSGLAGPGGLTTTLAYDANGLLTHEVDASGGVHDFTYDGSGGLTQDHNPDGVTSTLTSADEAGGHRVTLTAPSGAQTSYLSQHRADDTWVRTRTDPSGAATRTEISPDGTRTTFFPSGRKATVIPGADPRFGVLSTFAKSTTVEEPSGLKLTVRGSRSVALGNATDPFSVTNWTQRDSLGGAFATTSFDGASKTLSVQSPASRTASRTYDAKGRVTAASADPAVAPIHYAYDGHGNLVHADQGDRSADYVYDDRDRLTLSTDAAGNQTHHAYDAADHMTSTTTPGGEVYGFTHDGLGRLTSVTLPRGGVAGQDYTPFGLDAGFHPPGGGAPYTIARDSDGRRTSLTLPSSRMEQTTRSGDRPTQFTTPEATTVVTYAGSDLRPSQLVRTPTTGAPSTLQLAYDGDLATTLTWSGASSAEYRLTYDSHFKVSQARVFIGGTEQASTTYSRDGDDLPYAQGPFSIARGGPAGAMTSITGGPLSVTQAWDAQGRLDSRSDTVNGVAEYAMDLTRDNTNHITQKAETIGGVAHTYAYAYDPDGRLTSVKTDGTTTEAYAYDADGNRTSRTLGAGPAEPATYDLGDRLTSGATYNADGQLTARGGATFTYGTRGELLTATAGGKTVDYAYDGFGRRVARTEGGQTWQYLYGNPEQQLQVSAAIEPDGTLETLDYTDQGTLFSILRGANRLYVSTDPSGSPRVVSDAAGVVQKAVSYGAFGDVLNDSNPALVLPVGYAGGIPDPVTGLVHMGLRDYDPATGRFTTRDPLLLGGGDPNLYAYAGGDPIQGADPLGLGSAGATLCEGICVGLKFALTPDGFSACAEGGFGVGNDIEISPLGGLEGDRAYLKGSVEANLGPLANVEVSDELTSDGHCRKNKPQIKGCVVGGCVSNNDITLDPEKMAEAFTKGKVGLEAKAVAGVCQTVRW